MYLLVVLWSFADETHSIFIHTEHHITPHLPNTLHNLHYKQRNLKKEQDGWMGSLLLPLVLFSEKSDGNYLVVGISPVGPDTEIDEAQQVCK